MNIARQYVSARSIVMPPRDGHLRWSPALRRPDGSNGPGLVSLITDPVTGKPMSLHFTFINVDGTKATKPGRLYLKNHRKQGGVVRLWPDEAVNSGLAIAEGIETALSLAHAFTPVWACLDAGNLATFPVLPGVESLTIGADHDPAGLKAAHVCAERWLSAGREVRIIVPPIAGADLNDIARAA